MKKLMIGAVCAMMAAATFAEPSVKITKAYQKVPGSGVVDYSYMVGGLGGNLTHNLNIEVTAEGCVKTETVIVKNVAEGSATANVDVKTLLGKAYPNVTLFAELKEIPSASVPKDTSGFDYTTDGVTFVPGDYCVVDLLTGNVMEERNVTDGSKFNAAVYKTTKMAFRYVPAGKFKAKCADEYGYGQSGKPLVSKDVTLSAYWMAVFPVTEAQFNAVVGGETTSAKPKASISWNGFRGGSWNGSSGAPGSSTFVGKLNSRIANAGCKDTFDLCTSFQWERAVRAGTRTDYFFSDKTATAAADTDYKDLYNYAWFTKNSGGATHDVGGTLPNAWGLYDVYGNAYLSCLDWHAALSTVTPGTDYAGPTSGSSRVRRGGFYNDIAGDCSSVYRDAVTPDYIGANFCYRLVRKPAK